MTLYLTNAASRRPPQRGPGRTWTLMAAPRAKYGETGDGPVPALVPPVEWVRAALVGELPMAEYRERYTALLRERFEQLAPGALAGPFGPLGDGDTLICACSRERAARGECHRVWAAAVLAEAGWRVVLDGHPLQPAQGRLL